MRCNLHEVLRDLPIEQYSGGGDFTRKRFSQKKTQNEAFTAIAGTSFLSQFRSARRDLSAATFKFSVS